MRHLFVILDTSGSIALEGNHKIGQINDLIRELISVAEGNCSDARLITYSDQANVYWRLSSGEYFADLTPDRFGGRSDLGKAYSLIKEILTNEGIPVSETCLALISDGEATDNYSARLAELDPRSESTRVGGCIGNNRLTLDRHVGSPELVYPDVTSLISRDEFLDEIVVGLTS